jgi:cobalamin biosynthesis protein CobT
MKKNPFSTVLRSTGGLWTADKELDVVFVNLPPGQGAGYRFANPPSQPRPMIRLPRICVNELNQEEQRKLNGFMYHEMKHHDLTDKDSMVQSNKTGDAFGNLYYWLEEARIELYPKNRTVGPARDLDHFRFNQFKEMAEKTNLQSKDRWGWLFTSFFYRLRNIGALPINDDMVKFSDMGWGILQDGRYEKAFKMKRNGGELLYEIVVDMMKAFQLERDKEEEKQNEENGKENPETDLPDGDDDSPGKGDEGGQTGPDQYDSKDDNDDREGSGPEASPETGEENPEESDPKNERTGDGSEGDDDQSNDNQPNKNGTDVLPDGNRTERDGKKDGDNAAPVEKPSNGKDAPPQSIEKEYQEAHQGEGGEEDPTEVIVPTDELGKQIAGFDQVNDPDAFGDHISATPTHRGDPYIPYTMEDEEIVPSEFPEEYQKIKEDISFQVQTLRKKIVRILTDKSQCTVERNLRRGELDPRQYYKILNGSNRVKMQTDEGINLDAALTLLVDLSGSMSGQKAQLAIKIAASYGEALKTFSNIPLEILGYNTGALTVEGKKKAEAGGFSRREQVHYWMFKKFNEPWKKVCNRMGAAAHGFGVGGATGGCNIDHENLLHAAHRLYDRQEKNKVMIVLCDGAPNGYNGTYGDHLPNSLHAAIKRVRESGIKLFCFGIMAEQVRKYYEPHVEIVNSLKDLDKKALNKLASFLLSQGA